MRRRPVRDRLRERGRARAGLETPPNLQQRSLDVAGRRRTFSLAPAQQPDASLLIVLHGAGGTGAGMAAMTQLAERAAAAGFAAVFPDGVSGVWNDERDAPRLAQREGVDDVGFLRELVDHLVADKVVNSRPAFAVGMSNGAFLAEHIARHALLPLAGVGLVAGTATGVSRQAVPTPRQALLLLAFAGTADPLVPYNGGPIGPLGRIAQRRGARHGSPGRGIAAPVEEVMTDWVSANGCLPNANIEREPLSDEAVSTTRLTWSAPGRPSVILYRIEGGGHTWPGGAPYLPTRFVGPVANLDATGILLQAFQACYEASG